MSVICARISGVLRSSCILWAVKLTTKNTKNTENFALFFRSAGRLRSGERGLLARGARQLAEQKSTGERRYCVWVAHASRVLAMTSRHRGLLRRNYFGETPKVRAGLAFARKTCALPGNRSELSMRSGVFS